VSTVASAALSAAAAAVTVHLYPGQMHVSPGPSVVRTILGSCVSVCLWDPLLKVGGLNHYLLPRGPANRPSDLRYGATAIPHLLHAVIAHGAVVGRLQAKVFGGGAVLEPLRGSGFSLAADNVAIAREELQRRGIPIVEEETGGRAGRRLVFETHTGNASVKEL
jgi:chemotaxis protein CheD